MGTQHYTEDQRIIHRYMDQPIQLPVELRARIEALWGGQQVQLYAFLDLDSRYQIGDRWIAVGRDFISVAEQDEVVGDWLIDSFSRSRVRGVLEAPMLSGNVLWILAGSGEAALAVLRYTNRQRRAVENVKFVLEQQLEGRVVASAESDADYASAIAGPVREAQALVAGNRMAVLWRLLSYLKPYRKQVVVGMSAATVITLVSLVPPYVAGYLVDRVVRPVQDGTLALEAGARIAWLAVGAIATVYVIRQVSALIRLRMMSVLGEFVARDLRTELYEHLQRLSSSFLRSEEDGSLITRVSSDTDRLWEFLAFGVVDVSLSISDAHRAWRRVGQSRLAARPRDDDTGAVVLLCDLSSTVSGSTSVRSRVAEVVG